MKAIKIKNIINSMMMFVLIVMTSCSDEIQINDTEEKAIPRLDGVPTVMNVSIDDGESVTRAEDYEWPEGATMEIWNYQPYVGITIVYNKETGWTAYNLGSENLNEFDCTVLYCESWTYDDYLSNKYFYQENTPSDVPFYCNHSQYYQSYDYGKYDKGFHNKATCLYKDGVLYLNAILGPFTRRYRFVTDYTPPTVKFNHAERQFFTRKKDGDCATSVLSFQKESDGKYYSNYIYSGKIPELRIDGYVYKFIGKQNYAPNASGCVTLPTLNKTTSTWKCEKYFEIIDETEQVVTLNKDSENKYYLLYAHKVGNNPKESDNSIASQICLKIEMDYSYSDYYKRSFSLTVYNSRNGYWNYKNSDNFIEQGYGLFHACPEYNITCFYPVIYNYDNVDVDITIQKIKYSNF